MRMRFLSILTAVAAVLLPSFAQAAEPVLNPFKVTYGYLTGVSDNGRYGVSCEKEEGVSTPADVIVYDFQTGETHNLYKAPEGVNGQTTAVSNDGQTVAGSYEGVPAVFRNGEWKKLPMPPGTRGYGGYVTDMTPDGRIMVSWLMDAAWQVKSALWVDDELVELTGLPTKDIGGTNNPEYFYNQISSDGRYVLVGVSTNHPGWGCSYLVYDRETSTWDYVGVAELGNSGFIDVAYMSNNGKYVTGIAHMAIEVPGSDWPIEYGASFIYNVETKEFTTLTSENDLGVVAFAVDNAGVLYGATPADNPVRSLMIRNGNMWVDLDQILKQNYNIDFNTATGFDNTGTPVAVSDDGKSLAAFCYKEESYGLTLDKTFLEASEGVNLLSNFQLYPGTGNRVARIKDVVIEFERAVTAVSGVKAAIKLEGSTVVSSRQVTQVEGSPIAYVISFKETQLQPDRQYTLEIPAGMFVIEGTEMQNGIITAAYIGREEKPVEVRTISPKEGSAVSEISYNNMVQVTFDNVVVAGDMMAELYQEGSETPLAQLNIVAQGKQMYLYPSTARKLMKGSKYVIKVPQGAVTDITGYCPNEAFEINYDGIFVITPPDPGKEYLFYDDFTDPFGSLSNWLLYEGDHLQPVEEMEAIGFDKDNTPWNFSLRDSEDSDDFFAGAHSMYVGGGKADDWMSTPQLDIANEYFFLSFKAQGYKQGKTDRLKVIVWKHDEFLSTLTADDIADMRANGVVIYDSVEVPGGQENVVDGWTEHNDISLAQFAGQKIYIAFLNENEGGSAIFLDDVAVTYKGNFQSGCTTPTTVVKQESVPVKGYVRITNDSNFDSLTAKWESKNAQGTFEATGLNLKQGDLYEFEFDTPLPLTVGKASDFVLTVTMGTETQATNVTIKNLAFEPDKRVVLEEGTGAWCSNCVRGIVEVEHLETLFPETFIPVCIHDASNGADPAPYPQYNAFMGFNAFPSARVNRNEEHCVPMYAGSDGIWSFSSPEGDKTFSEHVLKAFETPAEAEIVLGNVEWNAASEMIEIPVDVRFALDMEDVSYNIFAVLLEDDVLGFQNNPYGSTTQEIFGEWGAGGRYSKANQMYLYQDVARGICGTSFFGMGGLIPTTVLSSETYSNTLQMEIPKVNKLAKCKVVCMLINNETGRVVNAARAKVLNGSDYDSGVESIIGEKELRIVAANGQITVNGTTDGVEIYSLQGLRMPNGNLPSGPYILRATRGTQTLTTKVLLR